MAGHILFDLDGTLTDPFVGITASVQHALRRSGVTPPGREALRPFIGPPLGESFARFYGMNPEQCAAAVGYYREYFAETGLYENLVFAGMPALLADLVATGRRLYLATSKPLLFAEKILRHFGLDGYFTGVYGSEMDGGGTPKDAVIAQALAGGGIDPADALMVGDTVYDMRGAAANGVRAIGVLYGGNCDLAAFEDAGAAAVAATVDELRALLLPGEDAHG